MSLERGYIIVDDAGGVTANRQVDPVADISLSGGGGSLPSWWTVDSTPGAESVDFAGALLITSFESANGLYLDVGQNSGIGGGALVVFNNGPNDALFVGGTGGEIGFFGAGATARPTGVAATGPGIHAALVTLGLITA